MNDIDWCKRHLNWAFTFAVVAIIGVCYLLLFAFGDSQTVLSIVAIVYFGGWLGISVWVLKQKGQSLLWAIFALGIFGWIPVILRNKNG